MIMPNLIREKLTAGLPTVGTHFLSSDPDIPELIGDTGFFDYGEFCAEYSAFDMQLLYHLARAGQAGGLPLMIKLDQENQGFWAQTAIGAGFKALLFTDIRTPDDVSSVHRLVRPDNPNGKGLMGVKLRRPALSRYEPDGYLENLSSIVLSIMIEKKAAVDNIDEILAVAQKNQVDMTQWGPADFGFSLGKQELMRLGSVRPVEELVIRKSIEYGVAPRIEISDVEEADRYIDLGVRHFCIGWDRFIYRDGLLRIGEGVRKLVDNL